MSKFVESRRCSGFGGVQLRVGVAVHHYDLPDEARHARIENRFLLSSASLPPQHAQHRRALGTPALRASLRRKEGLLAFITQHLRASVRAKAAPPLVRPIRFAQ